jgi:hypothetical protein
MSNSLALFGPWGLLHCAVILKSGGHQPLAGWNRQVMTKNSLPIMLVAYVSPIALPHRSIVYAADLRLGVNY